MPCDASCVSVASVSDERVHEVRYLGVDIVTFNELQSHNDAVVRDMVLAAGGKRPSRHFEPAGGLGATSRIMGEKREVLRAQADQAIEGHRSVVDLTVYYTDPEGRVALDWMQLLDDADEMTRRGELLVPLPKPEVVRLRRWMTEQLRAQVFEGRPAEPYPGLDHHASR